MQLRPIQKLSPDLVNRIAAGEVIERPASVVKELVENALDAGAGRITVEITDGGRSLIRVSDDGCGIPPRELPLAFASHATSKLRDDAELTAIATMGFRGEALASIASVSRARIVSRCGDGEAFELRCDGGELTDVRPTAGNPGTVVEIRDLFYNTPARRKFLKSPAAESGQVTEMLVRLALPRPDVAFRYERDGRLVSDWPAGNEVERLKAGWPGEYRQQAMPLEESDADGWRLSGLAGLPEYAATTARYQHLFVNRRPVRDRTMSHALREAFRGLTEPGRHPAAVLLLELPGEAVDVNVHPTKAEVRFRDAGRVWHLVNATVRRALLECDLVPTARPREALSIHGIYPGNGAAPGERPGHRPDVRESLASFFKEALGEAQRNLQDEVEGGVGRSTFPAAPDTRSVHDPGRRFAQSPAPGAVPEERDAEKAGDPSEFSGDRTDSKDAMETATESQTGPAPVRALQLHNSYLVLQSEEGLEIIDQHALHERILFEELLSRVRRGPLESQRLLMPATFEAPEPQVALLEELGPLLGRLGIEAEPFGPGVVAVHAFPTLLERLEPGGFVRAVLEKAEGDWSGAPPDEEAVIHEVLDLMACRAAVKAGDPLTAGEIEALVSRRHAVPRSSNCPHGRPTTLKLSLSDLERQFKRTGF